MGQEAEIIANRRVAASVRLLRLRLKEPQDWTFQAGQFVILAVPQRPEDAKAPKGFYSIASAPAALPELELLVEHREDGGYVSGWVSALQTGDRVSLDGPLGHFALAETQTKGQAFIGFRAGLAPLRSMILASLAQGGDRHHWLFLGGRGQAELLLDAEWRALAQAEARFHYLPVVQPTAANPFVGKNQDPADELIKKIAQRRGLRLYLAGFSKDVDPMKAKLQAAGFEPGDLLAEKFG